MSRIMYTTKNNVSDSIENKKKNAQTFKSYYCWFLYYVCVWGGEGKKQTKIRPEEQSEVK